jgi:plastocyanin
MTTHTKSEKNSRFRRTLLVGMGVAVVAVAVILVGCSSGGTTTTAGPTGGIVTTVPSGGGSTGGATVEVKMEGMAFSPQTVTIKAGDTVTWTNMDQPPHNATAVDSSWKTSTLATGETGSVTFATAGTFPYICTIHPNMTGTVIVQ